MEIENEAVSVIQTPHGTFSIDPVRDYKMTQVLKRGKLPTSGLITLAAGFVTKNSTVVDVGAHIGTFTVPVSQFANNVIAFEPSKNTYELLAQNTKSIRTVQVHNKGLGQKTGRARVQSRTDTNAGSQTLVDGDDIEISTMDSEITNADFIKIDVEGMEMDVLLGGRHLIERSKPIIVLEVNLSQLRSHHSSPKMIDVFFRTHSFDIFFPIFDQKNEKQVRLSLIKNLELLSLCIAPKSWIFRVESAPFDIIAVPHNTELPFPKTGFSTALWDAIMKNLLNKAKRIRAFLVMRDKMTSNVKAD